MVVFSPAAVYIFFFAMLAFYSNRLFDNKVVRGRLDFLGKCYVLILLG